MERYKSILTEKMIMQAIYSESIVEIKTWNDMNDKCTLYRLKDLIYSKKERIGATYL